MSLRAQLLVLLVLAIGVAGAVLYYSARFLEDHIVSVLPPTIGPETVATIHLLVYEQLMVTAFCIALLGLAVFWVISSLVATPLRKLVVAMNAFAKEGTRAPLPSVRSAPSEIRTLTTVFGAFIDTVLTSHQKDEDISRVKSDFISTAAHQLRTPLTGIRWALEALEKEPLTPEQLLLVKNATDKSHDLVAIVATLLDISSIESGKFNYKFELVNLEGIVAGVARDFSPLAQKRQVSLFYAKGTEAIPMVRIDSERIKWVLNNLVENAIRYTPESGTVQLTMGVEAGKVVVKVKDTGIGIEAKDRGNIFERFYRAGNAITKENQGNGLGLYIARTIATDHGGDLNFLSNPDSVGTTFVLSLPVAA